MCGENISGLIDGIKSMGSSPRVRGKRDLAQLVRDGVRLIPACAGKTALFPALAKGDRAHPRVCGENAVMIGSRVANTGSSPRVRGKRLAVVLRSVDLGLIPACAGKTETFSPASPATAAHPRVCGENILVFVGGVFEWGSSPRVRGKPQQVLDIAGSQGLIPACAGKTA